VIALATSDDAGIRLQPAGPIEIAVVDTGSGFATKLHQVPLTAVCQSAGQSLTREVQGTGLGLGIVAGILSLHGSVASIDSEPGSGSCIRFSLPPSVNAVLL